MELLACLDTAELNRSTAGYDEKAGRCLPREMRRLVILETPETSMVTGSRAGLFGQIDTRPRPRANARERADWIDVYELSKKPHRSANSAAVRRERRLLIGSPHRGQFQVATPLKQAELQGGSAAARKKFPDKARAEQYGSYWPGSRTAECARIRAAEHVAGSAAETRWP